jgi:hypothetical protein
MVICAAKSELFHQQVTGIPTISQPTYRSVYAACMPIEDTMPLETLHQITLRRHSAVQLPAADCPTLTLPMHWIHISTLSQLMLSAFRNAHIMLSI